MFELGFDAAFFSRYEQELDEVNIQKLASEALGSILTLHDKEGVVKSYEDIKAETERFFSNPLVAQDMSLLDSLALQYAQFCNHNHEAAGHLNEGGLSNIYELGAKHQGTVHEDGDDKEKKRKKITKKTSLGILDLFLRNSNNAKKPAKPKHWLESR